MFDTTQDARCAVLHSAGRQAARNYSDPRIKWVEVDSIRAANETHSRSVPARVAMFGARKSIDGNMRYRALLQAAPDPTIVVNP
jgi:hypothetical protein